MDLRKDIKKCEPLLIDAYKYLTKCLLCIKHCAHKEDTKITRKLILVSMYMTIVSIWQKEVNTIYRGIKYLGSLEEEHLILVWNDIAEKVAFMLSFVKWVEFRTVEMSISHRVISMWNGR